MPPTATTLSQPVTALDHALGAADAPLTLVEYGDYECPHCGRLRPILHDLLQHFPGRLRLVYRHFPLATVHRHAQHAAEAAETAAAQDKFWPMHDLLFQHQSNLTDEDLVNYADQIGLNLDQFMSQMKQHLHAPRVRDHFQSGLRSGVTSTPTLFLNSTRLSTPHDMQSLHKAISSAT